jgi:hypothetical protein
LLAHGRWFSPDTPASSTTKTGRHDIAEILLKVALKHKKIKNKIIKIIYLHISVNLELVKKEQGVKTIIKQNTSKQTQWTNIIRRVSRYQTANQNPYIEEGETTQLPKEKEHKDKKNRSIEIVNETRSSVMMDFIISNQIVIQFDIRETK